MVDQTTPDLRSLLAGGPVYEIAPHLLGLVLECEAADGLRAGVIVEVEAYDGASDPASHAFRGPTPRNGVMFGPPGRLYVYRSYGIHWCANVVCGAEGVASAVLMRALEPMAGVEAMWADRPKARREIDLASGPGKLCAALAITGDHDGTDLLDPASPVRLARRTGPVDGHGGTGRSAPAILAGPRVGITKAVERRWRFAWADNPHVSRPRVVASGVESAPASGSGGA